jgi:hypothetical protein
MVLAGIAAALLWGAGSGVARAQAVNQDSLKVAGFQKRIDAYLQLRQQVVSSKVHKQKPTDSPEEIAEHQEQLAHELREARPDAQQGDLFTPEMSVLFRKWIAAYFAGPDGTQIKVSLRRADPVPPLRLRVNARYPEKLPLQSTPPSILEKLPQLPKELEYRFVGHDLVLLDVGAGMIVDYLPRALPSS